MHIYLGLAAAGDAVQQERSALFMHRLDNCLDCAFLRAVEHHLLIAVERADVRTAEGDMPILGDITSLDQRRNGRVGIRHKRK